MAVLIFALVLVPAATEAESEKKEDSSKRKIELKLDMSIEEVKKLKGKPHSVAKISGPIKMSGSNISHSLPKGQYHLYLYDDIMIAFLNGKLLTVR